MSSRPPIIGITIGDPKGIGPEVVQKALASKSIRRACRVLVFGDAAYFDWKKSKKLTPAQCGRLSGSYIEQAAHACLNGYIDAMVTAPISKEHLNAGGYKYPGHTEFLADLAGVKDFRMMMAGPSLKTVLVTIHEPIRQVASLLTKEKILQTIRITDDHLRRWFGIPKPRIAVAALNPHAGEGGMFGDEEKKIILPAIREARKRGINATGPHPPDTIFYLASRWGVSGGESRFSPRFEPKHPALPVRGGIAAVVAMYHDQGLIPLKVLHFDRAVNITLGLPFIRTSVDHGTAFDIAGKGIADPSSLIAAIETAVELATNSERRKVSFRRER